MSQTALEDAVADALATARETLGVSRARCYAMDPSGSFRLAAFYGFGSRFGPDDVLEASHPLIEWVHRHRRPTFVNSPRDAGALGPMMEREHYAHSLTIPLYQGSRHVGILELQDKTDGSAFTAEDLRRMESIAGQITEILSQFDGTEVTAPEPMPEEDREALFLTPRPRATDFPNPPDLFSASEEADRRALAALSPSPAAVAPRAPAWEGPARLTRRELVVFKGFTNALLLSPEIEAVVFSHWTQDAGELYVGARRPLAPAAQGVLLRGLEEALLSAVPDVPVPRQRRFHMDFPLGQGSGEIREPGGIQTSVIASGRNRLLLTLVFTRPPMPDTEAALKETHRLIRAAVLQIRGAERYRLSYRSLVNFLLEPDRKNYPQLKAHSLSVGALCRQFAVGLRLPPETVEQFTVGGLLHDIGLKDLDIPYERLTGRRPLDLQELGLVRQHPAAGATLLSRIDFPYSIASLVRHHHERFDGAGYPDRLSGDRIPLGARIIAIAEAYDAMVSPYSYRAPISRDGALEIILLKGGTQFDPELARHFNDLVRDSSAEEDRPSSNEP